MLIRYPPQKRMPDPTDNSESVWRLLKMPADSPLRSDKVPKRNLNIHIRAANWRNRFDRQHAVAVFYGYTGGEDFFEANGFYW